MRCCINFVVVFLMTFQALGTSPAYSDVCEGKPAKNGQGSPFLFIDMPIVGSYVVRELCGLDTTNDLSFWRSYYNYYGCSADSMVGRTIERMLAELPDRRRARFEKVKIDDPKKVEEICSKARKCILPPKFDPEAKNVNSDGKQYHCDPVVK